MNRFLVGSATLLLPALFGAASLEAKGKEEAHLRYAATYADAIAQAKARNTLLFITFHKDK